VRRIAILFVAALVLAGCGGDDNGSSSSDLSTFESTTAVAAALTKAGVECDGFAVESEEDAADAVDLGLPQPAEVGHCSSKGDQLEIDLYAKPEQVTQSVSASKSEVFCNLATSFGITTIKLAFGHNWIVGGMSDDPATYAKAIGGDSSSYDCPDAGAASTALGFDRSGLAPDDARTIQTDIGEMKADDSSVYPQTDDQCDAVKAAGEKLSEESPISDLLGIDPPEGGSDWGYAC
jgi:hypothetical protein